MATKGTEDTWGSGLLRSTHFFSQLSRAWHCSSESVPLGLYRRMFSSPDSQETRVRDPRQADDDTGLGLQTLPQAARVVGAILGAIAILIGLVYATRIFGLVFDALHKPEAFQAYLDKWAVAVGGPELDVVIDGATVHCARTTGLIVIGCGTAILAWIAMGFMVAGAKIIAWTVGDRQAVKQLLAQASVRSGGQSGQNPPRGNSVP